MSRIPDSRRQTGREVLAADPPTAAEVIGALIELARKHAPHGLRVGTEGGSCHVVNIKYGDLECHGLTPAAATALMVALNGDD